MDALNTFTSTGSKLIHHPQVVTWLRANRPRVLSLQAAPTSLCNLNCNFCSNANRTKGESIDFDRLIKLIDELHIWGLRTVEWTGGGDPTLYTQINEAVAYCSKYFRQGMITNGLGFANLSDETLESLFWIRISMNGMDYDRQASKPPSSFKGTLSMSYVYNELTTQDTLDEIKARADAWGAQVIRVVPNCLTTDEEQDQNNKILAERVKGWGKPWFYQPKVFGAPERCYWGYIKPFALHDGYIYPCSSVVLNEGSEGVFHSKYRWATYEAFVEKYSEVMVPFEPINCSHCVFRSQNDLVSNLINPTGMEDFV